MEKGNDLENDTIGERQQPAFAPGSQHHREQTQSFEQDEDPIIADERAGLGDRNQLGSGTDNRNYGAIDDADHYPDKIDDDMRAKLAAAQAKNTGAWRCLNMFHKLRGHDEQQDFVIKVLSILTFQIFLTCGFITGVWMMKDVKEYLKENIWVYFVALGLTIIILYAVVCFRSVGRTTPYNYIALVLFTLFESVMLATLTTFFTPMSVMLSAGLALLMFVTLVIVALLTKRSFKTAFTLMIVGMILSLAMIPLLIFFTGRWVQIVVSVVMLVVAAFYVLYDIDLITEKNRLDFDEYVFASINLYLDLAMIFVYILSLVGDRA